MNVKLEFLVYCIEEYKRRHGTTGCETYHLFERSGASRYILDNYDALHTAGIEYTLNDIEGLLGLLIGGYKGRMPVGILPFNFFMRYSPSICSTSESFGVRIISVRRFMALFSLLLFSTFGI